MAIREEFLKLLQIDSSFREEIRHLLLTGELLTLPELMRELIKAQQRTEEQVRELAKAQQRTEEQVRELIQAQQRTEEQVRELAKAQQRTEEQVRELIQVQQHTEEELGRLVKWQRGEVGRRDGERYQRDILRQAPLLFNGGQGGSTDQPSVQQRLSQQLSALLPGDLLPEEENPFLADLIWWKGEKIAIVEVSLKVNGRDVERAAQRAEVVRRAGNYEVLPLVIGERWSSPKARRQALSLQVEWKVSSDISPGFLAFRRLSPSHSM